jgi:hypothetical protein
MFDSLREITVTIYSSSIVIIAKLFFSWLGSQ